MAQATVKFVRSGSTAATLTHNLTISGTATFPTDYTVTYPAGVGGSWLGSTATINYPIGVSEAELTFSSVGDTTYEVDETIVVELTSTTPVTPISTTEFQTIIVLKNDDVRVQRVWIGVGLPRGTTLQGTITNPATAGTGLDVIGVLRGTAGVWPNHVTASSVATLTNTFVNDLVANDPLLPTIAKYVCVAPVQSPTVGVVALIVSQTNVATAEVRLYWGCTTAGQWRLFIGSSTSTTATAPLGGTANGVLPGATVDCIIVKTPGVNNSSVYMDGTLVASNVTLQAAGLNRFDLTANAGLAAMSVVQGINYSTTMFPITTSNL